MRVNEFTCLEDFTSAYVGVWNPSRGHWFGLEFIYRGNEYRFDTGLMFADQREFLPDGRKIGFGLYQKKGDQYFELELFASVEDALESRCIEGVKFRDVITDPNTELTAQD